MQPLQSPQPSRAARRAAVSFPRAVALNRMSSGDPPGLLHDDGQVRPEGFSRREVGKHEDLVGAAGDAFPGRCGPSRDDGRHRRPHVAGQGPGGTQQLVGLLPCLRYDPDTRHILPLT